MSWFSSSFSLSAAPSPEQDRSGKIEPDDDGETSSQEGKGVTDELFELTKNLTQQFWGVASFLAPPPIQVESPNLTSTPQMASHSMTIAGKSEDPQVAVDVVAKEEKEIPGFSSVAEVAGMEFANLAESQETFEGISNSSASGSPSASGEKFTGFRSDLAELKGTMATGFSRIQTVIRAVTQDEDEDEDEVGENSLAEDGFHQDNGLSSLLKPLLVSMSSFHERLPRSERDASLLDVGERVEGDMDYKIWPKPAGQSSLAGSIGGLSRFATNFIPYARDIVGEISRKDYFAVALTDEVVAFADNIAMHHPETWLDFPLLEEEENEEFEMTEIQHEHAKAVEELSSRLAAVHRELCPAFISDGRFWKIYFVLLHSRLSKEDAELLSTSQILKAREVLLQIKKPEPKVSDTAPTTSEREELGLTESNMTHLRFENVAHEEHFKSSAESTFLPIMEEVSLDYASHSKSESSQEILSVAADVEEGAHESRSLRFTALKLDDEDADANAWLDQDEGNDVNETADRGAAVSIDEDVSFSDLEDDDDECSKKENGSRPVERDLSGDDDRTSDQASQGDASSGSKSEGDWLTVNKEDVASPTSISP